MFRAKPLQLKAECDVEINNNQNGSRDQDG